MSRSKNPWYTAQVYIEASPRGCYAVRASSAREAWLAILKEAAEVLRNEDVSADPPTMLAGAHDPYEDDYYVIRSEFERRVLSLIAVWDNEARYYARRAFSGSDSTESASRRSASAYCRAMAAQSGSEDTSYEAVYDAASLDVARTHIGEGA